jgi:hypothetical protein
VRGNECPWKQHKNFAKVAPTAFAGQERCISGFYDPLPGGTNASVPLIP